MFVHYPTAWSLPSSPMNKTTSQNLWPRINSNEVNTARFLFLAASAAKFWKREISSTSERAFPDYFGHVFGCSTPSKRGALVHKNALTSVNGIVTASSHALWRVLSNKVIWVLGHVVSNEMFWNWNGVVRFASQKVWFDKGFVIWHFCNYCFVQIVSLRSFSIGVRNIFTTTVLIDRIKNFKWNTSSNE